MRPGLTLVANPAAGKGRARTLLPQVAGVLREALHRTAERGTGVQVLLSRDFGEARRLLQQAVSDGARALAVMGGDGMMHLGLNICAGPDRGAARAGATAPTLGLIPAGTGNDFCRGLGLDPRDPLAATRVIAAGHTRSVDLIRVADRHVGAVLATGFDARVNDRANAMAWPKGSPRYALAALAELRVFSPLHYRITLDGQVRELDAMFVAVGNCAYYGGGMRICPQADPTDGLLDVTIVHPVGRAKLLQLLPQMYSGRFARDPCVEQLRAREVRIEGAGLVGFGDGEPLGPSPFTATADPGALEVFA